LNTGSNVEDMFSLSSDEYEPENASLGKDGVVGVRGMSSDASDKDVEQLIGVPMQDVEDRLGVMGRDMMA
jgi:hypothetical protein